LEHSTFVLDGSLVAALDVLEHLDDDRAALRALGEQLRLGGLVLLTVPAFPALWSGHDEEHHHRRRYTKRTLIDRIIGVGLSPIYVTFFNSFLFPLIAGVRLCKAALGLHNIHDDTLPPQAINRLFAAIFASEYRVLRRVRLPVGVSLLMLARKVRI